MNLFFTNIAYADGVDDFIHNVNGLILNPLIKLLFALALAFFFYGVLEFIMNLDKDEAKTVGKTHMLWGIIGMTIMFSVWGLMNLVLDTFGITGINPKAGTVNLEDYNPNFPSLNNNPPQGNPGTNTSDSLPDNSLPIDPTVDSSGNVIS